MLLCASEQLAGAVRGLAAFCLLRGVCNDATKKKRGKGILSVFAAWRNISTQGGTCLLPSSLEPETLKGTWKYSLKINSW